MTDKEILEAYKDAIRRAEVPVVHYWNSYPVEGRWVITAQGG